VKAAASPQAGRAARFEVELNIMEDKKEDTKSWASKSLNAPSRM
jgi:hypothetical protein